MVRRLMFPCLLPASVCAQHSSAFGWESNCLHLLRVGRSFALRAVRNLTWREIAIRVLQRRAHAVARLLTSVSVRPTRPNFGRLLLAWHLTVTSGASRSARPRERTTASDMSVITGAGRLCPARQAC